MSSQAAISFEAAKNLHRAMWRNDLEKRLLQVDKCKDLKYLPPNEVKDLRLQDLGCYEHTILVREEYPFAVKELEDRRRLNIGGVVVTGQPGIGKSIFLFYLLLHLLSMGEPVALQCDKIFFLFSENGVQLYDGETTGWNFQFEGKLWALSDSHLTSRFPCQSFQWFSRQNRAYIVQAAPPAEDWWKGWTKECYGALFIMKCFSEKEAKALSIILNLDVKSFLRNFKKWGPNVLTCVRLAHGSLTDEELQWVATSLAIRFVQDPGAITMTASSEDFFDVLFTVTPTDKRSSYTLSVATPHLCGLVTEEIARYDAADRVSSYHRDLLRFQGTSGCTKPKIPKKRKLSTAQCM